MNGGENRRFEASRNVQRLTAALIMLIVAAAGGAVLFYVADRTPASAPKAAAGIIDLAKWDFSHSLPISLSGDWLFAPGSFSRAGSAAAPASVARVPGDWPAGPYGFGSYELTILRSRAQTGVAILVPDEAIAWRLYVDGELRAANGIPGETPELTSVRRESVVVALPDGATRTELRIEAANYTYDVGGLINPIRIGASRDLSTMIEALAILNGFFLGSLLVLCLYHFLLFVTRIDDRSSLFFALFCFLLLIRSLAIAHYPERLFPAGSALGRAAFEASTRIEYLAFFLCIPAYLAFVRSLFPAESGKRAFQASAALGLAFSAIAVSTSVPFFMAWTTKPYQAVTLIAGAYALSVFARAAAALKPGAAYGLVGFSIVMLAAVNDMLHSDLVIRSAHLAPLGILVFMIAQSFIVSTRIALTFRHERQLHDMDAAKSRFLATISHELRTPISLIISPIEQVMRGRYGESLSARGEVFAALRRNGYRLLNIVENMFDFARIELGKLAPRMEAVEPAALLAFYAAELESLAQRKGVGLSFENRLEGPCPVLLDPRLFEIAFFNIASNALKFTPAGGSVRIEARLEGKRLAVSVRDTGIGISSDLLPRIFDKLDWGASEGDRLYDGAGIGLSLSKKILALHSGEIRVESEVGSGSAFTMILPLRRASSRPGGRAADHEQGNEAVAAGISGRARSILSEEPYSPSTSTSAGPSDAKAGASEKAAALSLLLVEDNRELLEFMAERLAESFSVRAAGNGKEALGFLEEGRAPDIVISDVMMPGMDGPRLYKEARRLLGEDCPPFVFLTARNDPEERREALAEGVVDYLEKPFDLDELELKALNLVSMRTQARDGAKRGIKAALSRFLNEDESKGARPEGGRAERGSGVLDRLTPREAEIAVCAAGGLQDKEIAAKLGLSVRTVSNTLARIYRKAGVEGKLELMKVVGEPE